MTLQQATPLLPRRPLRQRGIKRLPTPSAVLLSRTPDESQNIHDRRSPLNLDPFFSVQWTPRPSAGLLRLLPRLKTNQKNAHDRPATETGRITVTAAASGGELPTVGELGSCSRSRPPPQNSVGARHGRPSTEEWGCSSPEGTRLARSAHRPRSPPSSSHEAPRASADVTGRLFPLHRVNVAPSVSG